MVGFYVKNENSNTRRPNIAERALWCAFMLPIAVVTFVVLTPIALYLRSTIR